ncbi:Alg9-like mannosyltransferase [Hesseltinella vesiculosa]|uniref:Mannosyltransferase n=1 Tax=Hesseltinella vesiculosa TaxID=101127 RepID=A0A1X2GLW8_9FUNG|nr:Alg9-like mannosyltransferase [Hesseltinella vesiculosa]
MGKTFNVFYIVLVGIRLLLALSPGYIHPDEYFQSPEIMARSMLNIDAFVPWEYQPEHAARSILIPFLTTGLPFWLLEQYAHWFGTWTDVFPTVALFTVERVAFFALSLITDYTVLRLCRKLEKDELLPMLLTATSQVTMVYCTRPFSNATESFLLCLSLLALLSFDMDRTSGFALGALITAGLFNRITFLLFGLPTGLGFLYVARRQGRLIQSMIAFLLGASLTAAAFVFADSFYYGGLVLTWKSETEPLHCLTQLWADGYSLDTLQVDWQSIVLTPLNNLQYNLDVNNLATHGLHPLYTHLLIHFPLLFGPLAVMGIWAAWAALRIVRQDPHAYFFFVLLGTLVVGLVGLSSMPHQEARFLVPLLVPLVMLYTWDQSISIGSILFLLLWFGFNLVTGLIFANMHQGGLVGALSAVQKQTMGIQGCSPLPSGDIACSLSDVGGPVDTSGYQLNTHVIFYKTYMPPRHLLSIPIAWQQNGPARVLVEDVAGNKTKLHEALIQRQGSQLRRHKKDRIQIEFSPSKEQPGVYER